MLTINGVLADQKNLDQLCADRPLRTSEPFRPNAFYGMNRILKSYMNLPDSYSLKAIIPHGVILDRNFLWEVERDAAVPVILYYPPYRGKVYKSNTNKVAIPSTSPFLYVVEMLKNQPPSHREGTLFFPQHSTHHVTVNMDFDRLAESLLLLDREFKPITVCIYWKDYLLGHHLPFQTRGIRIMSAGHIFDPNFLFRLYHLFAMHKYAAGNGIGSHIFYSTASGCDYFHLHGHNYSPDADDGVLARDSSNINNSDLEEIKSLFAIQPKKSMSKKLDLVNYYLGANFFRSPDELRRLFLYTELLDKVGFVAIGSRRSKRFAAPPFYRRIYGKASKILSKFSRILATFKSATLSKEKTT